jgi:lipopolysaccharide export system protein LptA
MRRWGGIRTTLGVLVALVGMSDQMIWGERQVAAAESPAKQPSPFGALDFTSRQEPIHIRSHDLEFFYNQKRIIYRGSVVATQGDSTLKSSTLTVTYEDTTPTTATQTGGTANTTQGQKIKEIIAEENVEITSTTRNATCNKAVFSDTARTITLTGNAILRDEANEVTGQKVTIYVDEGRTTVEGDPRMVLTPKQGDKAAKKEGTR